MKVFKNIFVLIQDLMNLIEFEEKACFMFYYYRVMGVLSFVYAKIKTFLLLLSSLNRTFEKYFKTTASSLQSCMLFLMASGMP